MLKQLEMTEKFAVVQMIYQLIISSNNCKKITSNDDSIINLCESTLGCFTPLVWNMGINFDPFKSYALISRFTMEDKQEFVELLKSCVLQAENLGYNWQTWINISNQIMRNSNCSCK